MKPNASKNKSSDPIIIIGAGWSGLACAVTLVQAGYQVCLLESAPQVGGRARGIDNKKSPAEAAYPLKKDNGQHIMLGAYHFTLAIFKSLGFKQSELLQRHPLDLKLFSVTESLIHLKVLSILPAPLHLLAAFLTIQGLRLSDRLKIIKMALLIKLSGYQLKQDISVEKLLADYHQSKIIIKALWEPLCLATMNTPIKVASAQVFLNVLKDSFSSSRKDSDCLFFKQDLSRTFCLPAIQFIKAQGSEVYCREKVINIEIKQTTKNIKSTEFYIQTKQNNYYCQQMVLATPAHISKKLLDPSCLLPSTASFDFFYHPIMTIYLQYPETIKLPQPMVGFFSCYSNSTAQWAIDRATVGQKGLIAIVISGPGKHIQQVSTHLVKHCRFLI